MRIVQDVGVIRALKKIISAVPQPEMISTLKHLRVNFGNLTKPIYLRVGVRYYLNANNSYSY